MKRVLLVLIGLLTVAAGGRAADAPFDFETLRFRAKTLAARPYAARATTVPESLRKLSYDQYRLITFNADQTWWRRERLPFQLQFFHPGFVHTRSVQVFDLANGVATPIKFSRSLFNYSGREPAGLSDSIGFAGLRVLGSLGVADRPWDELVSFVGASYFRALCQKAVYGLSARGLAINSVDPAGEEFPVFEEFWIERPVAGAKSFVLYALMDSPSLAGAYRFTVSPGAATTMQVKAVVFCRQNPKVLGLAPLTSMFWHGENSGGDFGDIRPEVHDSDGLLLFTGAGEWLWRPLTNPKATRVSSFADENPRGFGLLQRDRKFESYEDLEVHYQLRPSAWIEPVGNWGRGAVRLGELSAPDETHDNIVAYWAPERLPPAGEPIEFEYKLHWFMDQIRPPAGFTAATRAGYSRTHEPELRRFVVDFDGPYLRQQKADPAIEPVVSVGEGAKLAYATVQKNQFNGTWRLAFGFKPDGSGRPVELRGFLRKPQHVLTETWTYLWQP
ncbi:MAG: glucan biosynthesis protein G [Verrucomicrobia bacterium]|nr:glucan biosynthesis protein G [Verrucomicrobiota bacterium]